MEERFLFLLLLLRQPRLRMIYVTSLPIAPEIVEYYLALLPGVIPSHARRAPAHSCRVNDASPRSLSREAARAPAGARAGSGALIPDRAASHLVPYNTTELERDVALSLGHPDVRRGPAVLPTRDQDRVPAAVRRGRACRTRWAARTCTDVDDVVDAIVGCAPSRPAVAQRDRQAERGRLGRGQRGRRARAASRDRARPTSATRSLRRLADDGARVPDDAVRRLRRASSPRAAASSRSGSSGDELRSPSVQLRVTPRRRGRAALDARPAARRRRAARATWAASSRPTPRTPQRSPREAAKIGERLAARGRARAVRGRLRRGPRRGGGWTPYAIELNLRKGGTTHPFLTLQFLTDGALRPGDGAVPRAERARRSTSSRPTTSSPTCCAGWRRTTCSTSSPGTGCTSTSPARPASSST